MTSPDTFPDPAADLTRPSLPGRDELAAFLRAEFPQTRCTVREAGPGRAVVVHPVGDAELRPGGTVSGPVLMATADVAIYVAILATIGIVPLAVTTHLSINFLRKPAAGRDVIGVCTLLKTGRNLVIGEVALHMDGVSEPVAHAVGTYAVPPGAERRDTPRG